MNFTKTIIAHPELYISQFCKNTSDTYLIFIHGGPGYNCGIIEQLIEKYDLFKTLNFNLIFYDQRGCGRSVDFQVRPTHLINVDDLNAVYHYLLATIGLKIAGFIGHSYGAKLLFDFYRHYFVELPGIFIATADSIITPRLNNLLLDLRYLKATMPHEYAEILSRLNKLDLTDIWQLTEELNPLFLTNKDRPLAYWANLHMYAKVQAIQQTINLPINNATFMSVRKDLYSNADNFSVAIATLSAPVLWLNGLHDYVMNGQAALFQDENKITFLKSAHYPHLEENKKFCEMANRFIA